MTDIVERLRKIAEQYKCPWGDPGSNPDYFSTDEYNDVLEAADEIERMRGIEQFVSEASRHERDGLRTEIERLRALLKKQGWIDDYTPQREWKQLED